MQNLIQHAIKNEKDVKEKINKVFSDISEEYKVKDKLLKGIKDFSDLTKHLGLKLLLIDLRNKD